MVSHGVMRVLHMQDEAEELYKKSQRYDLLNQFYQASGQWSKVGVAYFTFLQCNSFWYINHVLLRRWMQEPNWNWLSVVHCLSDLLD